ncbi:flagellar assembly protein FliW [Desulfonatronovibrio magnus]|uniref:flagellar assembly protein FliW n=1 Tax=Desulfonatronovibrio magnus TaxID=698827 RepID=UPI0005EAF31C|nr:flagellar assembly protein FliW [Desulfonatronovibrio magnus]
MDKTKQKEINSKLGRIIISPDKAIFFPRGLIGMERVKDFVLLQIKPDSPFYILQNLNNSRFSLLVADPFCFVTDYQVYLGNTEERVLKSPRSSELAIMVTVTIPQGCPEETTLNMSGPIVINTVKRIGMQVPQNDLSMKSRIVLAELREDAKGVDQDL